MVSSDIALVAALGASARVQLIADQLKITGPTDSKKLVARLLPVSHGDTVTVTYADKDVRGNSTGNIIKTAEVDLEAPVVTLVRPSDKLYTKGTHGYASGGCGGRRRRR